MAYRKTSREVTQDSIQLPKLSSTRVTGTGNPFQMPKDLELYKAKMLEKEQKSLAKDTEMHLSKKGQKSNMEGIQE